MVRLILLFVVLFVGYNISFCQKDSLNKTSGFHNEFSIGGAYQSGNLELVTIKSMYKLDLTYRKIVLNLYAQHGYNKVNKNTIQNDFFGYSILSIWKQKKIHPIIAGLYEKSRVRSIDNHHIFGIGFGWTIMNLKKYKLEITNLFAYEKKDFLINEASNYTGYRYSLHLKGKYLFLKEKLTLQHKFFLNPFLINETGNSRYRFLLDFLIPISKKTSTKVSIDYSIESVTDSGFESVNTLTTFGISLKL